MAFILNAEMHFCRVNPKFPNKYDPENPTWEVQIRTTDKAVKKEWETLGLPVKAIVPDDDQPPYFRAMLRRKSKKKDGTDNTPVEVVDGECNPLDPSVIGNGSIANIRIWQYEYPDKTKPGQMKKASILSAIQVTTLVESTYVPKEREEFTPTKTNVVKPATTTGGAATLPEEDNDDANF